MDIISLHEKALGLPQLPGVYLMKDESGRVLYVGKAVKLKNRVTGYFRDDPELMPEYSKTDMMISKVTDFDVVIVESEFEALLLENALIKDLMPKYNIKLRDDKGYPVIRVDMNETYPVFKIVQKPADDGALYLGPYGGRTDTRKAIIEVSHAFQLPTCGKKIGAITGKARPCLNHDIGNCRGYCADNKLLNEYKCSISAAIEVFQGKTGSLVRELTKEMTRASGKLDFETAADIRDRIKAIKRLEQKQFFKETPVMTEQAMYKEKELKTHIWLEKALKLEKTPERIEAFDISNTGDNDIVGSMTVFVKGKPLKRDYRHFKIKTKKNQDDYGSMAEVVSRRVKRYLAGDEKFIHLPDIILIDGGMKHAMIVKNILGQSGITVPVFGMVKNDKHRTRALVLPEGDEIGLSGNPAVFALIGRIQEETHRFAVEYHRKLRSKSMMNK